MQRIVIVALLFFCGSLPLEAHAIETSCDLITGASCLWKEECDCDGDGFVVDNNEKYCHYDECPLDADDTDPAVLGKVSDQNEDGDAWTTKYDCNDKDECIDKNCDNICTMDQDQDGFAANVDCDDENPYIIPESPEPCCACDVVLNIDKLAKYSCGTPPCPYDDLNPPPDGFGSESLYDALDSEAGGSTSDIPSNGGRSPDVDEDIAGRFLPPSALDDVQFPGSGFGPERKASCSASALPISANSSLVGLFAFLALLLFRRIRRKRSRQTWIASVTLSLLIMTSLVACRTVRPWQREQLAKAPMTFDADPLENQLEQHFLQYRESASGGFGGSGGGCGCN